MAAGLKAYVADTHALFWYLTASPRLGAQAKSAFDEGARGEAAINGSHHIRFAFR